MELLGYDLQFWWTLAVLGAMAAALLSDVARPEIVFVTATGLLLLTGIVTPQEAFAGFSNSAVIAVGALFVVAAGIEETGALSLFDRVLFGRSQHLGAVLPRLMLPVAGLSAFINNTPVVAMLTHSVQQWAVRVGVPPSKVLIPLSYAAIAGGMVTLMGSSTNIIVSGLLVENGLPGFGLFEMAPVGLVAVLVVAVFVAAFGPALLPDQHATEMMVASDLKECLFEARVSARAAIVGRTIEKAGLRGLEGAYVVRVKRQGALIGVSPDFVLQGGDVLTFLCDAATLEGLLRRPGLEPSVSRAGRRPLRSRPLFEAIVSDSSTLVGQSLHDVQFRDRYGGVVLAIQRRSERIDLPLGRLPIQAGDLLVIEAQAGFDERWNANRTDFYLVAPRGRSPQRWRQGQAPIALGILTVMIALVGAKVLALVTAAFLAALAMIFAGCITLDTARQALNLQVLLIIALALGLGHAAVNVGLTGALASGLVGLSAFGVVFILVALYVCTNLLTELITHKAAAVLMLPVALALASELALDPRALALTVTVAAAASFMTPFGYQTNLMVMAAGKYRVRDYLRVGLPVSLVVMAAATAMIFFLWL